MLRTMSTFDPTRFRALSFDCYGTLIDWERGILTALNEVFESRAIHADPDELLETYAVIEPRETRARLLAGLRLLETKRDRNPPKKHGNIPL